jgi:hypothetical protein
LVNVTSGFKPALNWSTKKQTVVCDSNQPQGAARVGPTLGSVVSAAVGWERVLLTVGYPVVQFNLVQQPFMVFGIAHCGQSMLC